VRRYAGCLHNLPGDGGRLLAIRAGLGAAGPATRAAAARQLGISVPQARTLERSSLRQLRSDVRSGACGSGGNGAMTPAEAAARASTMPQLQPAVLLTPRPALTSVASLGRAQDHQAVKGAHASSGSTASGGASDGTGRSTSAVVHGADSASTSFEYLFIVAGLALLMAIALLTWRRRHAVVGAGAGTDAPSSSGLAWTAAAAPEAPRIAEVHTAEPVDAEFVAHPEFEAPAEPSGARTAAPAHARPRHPAAMVAASLVSLGVTALLGRRRRRR
jgi:MYXO-CTERM domain-containing protein